MKLIFVFIFFWSGNNIIVGVGEVMVVKKFVDYIYLSYLSEKGIFF